MGAAAGPKVVKDGLVFEYDQANTEKSWKGAPVKNAARPFNLWHHTSNASITEILDGSIAPPISGARVFHIVSTSTTNAMLLRACGYYGKNWTVQDTPSNPDILGDQPSLYTTVGTGRWVYSCYVLGHPNNTAAASFSIDIGDRNGKNVVVGNGANGWQYIETDDTAGINSTSAPYDCFDGGVYPTAELNEVYVAAVMIGRMPGNDPLTLPLIQAQPRFIDMGMERSNTEAIVDLTGNNTITASSLTYNADGSFEFNGTSDYIDCGNNSILKSEYTTVSTWILCNSLISGSRLISDWHQVATGDRWILYANTTSTIQWYIHSSVGADVGISYTMPLGAWVNLVGTFDGTNTVYYANGTLVDSVAKTGIMVSGSGGTIRIGKQLETGGYQNGKINNVTIYNRALTAAEVKQNFEATRSRYGI